MRKEKGVYHKTFYCSELGNCSDGDKIFDIFLLSDVRYCSNDRGIKWLDINLNDRSGSIRAKVWSDRIQMEYEGFCGQIVLVSGRVNYFNGSPQISVDKMQLAKDEEFELTEVVRTLDKEKVQVYKDRICSMIEQIGSKDIKEYVMSLVNTKTLEKMAELPVHLKGHHSYRGGLLEHIYEVSATAYYYVKSTFAIRDIKYDVDLVLAGAMLHDIGSLVRYREDGYRYLIQSTQKLLGNSYATYMLLNDARKEKALEEETFGLLMHIVDASHGTAEPATMEAMIVRDMNRLSAEIEMYENSCLQNVFSQKTTTEFIWSSELKREISTVRRKNNGK